MCPYNSDMKVIQNVFCTLILSSIICAPSFGARFLKCLGAEEAMIHKKSIGGAYKKLNQMLLAQLVQLGENVILEKSIEDKLCDGSISFPSVFLLEKLLTEKKFIFESSTSKGKQSKRASEIRTISYLQSKTLEVFIQFLSDLQTEVKAPNCLVKIYPPLKVFYEQAQFLMVESGPRKILAQFPGMPKFFSKLRSPKWKLQCMN
jgi:hypothetical protein